MRRRAHASSRERLGTGSVLELSCCFRLVVVGLELSRFRLEYGRLRLLMSMCCLPGREGGRHGHDACWQVIKGHHLHMLWMEPKMKMRLELSVALLLELRLLHPRIRFLRLLLLRRVLLPYAIAERIPASLWIGLTLHRGSISELLLVVRKPAVLVVAVAFGEELLAKLCAEQVGERLQVKFVVRKLAAGSSSALAEKVELAHLCLHECGCAFHTGLLGRDVGNDFDRGWRIRPKV
mmetsp:Transcript_1259/g.2207  ORF Transcript_1259/g.2207 Transcript_1259/m.2207 type:complete len:236 (-) Transcript_1259:113-820(-)